MCGRAGLPATVPLLIAKSGGRVTRNVQGRCGPLSALAREMACFIIALSPFAAGDSLLFSARANSQLPPPSCGKKANRPRHTRLSFATLRCRPGYCESPSTLRLNSGLRTGKRGAWPGLPNFYYVARLLRPAGDFCPRPFRCALKTLRLSGPVCSSSTPGP
jgi:hypothetical protein